MGGQPTTRQAEERRKQFSKREREISALAICQHGVIARAQLLDAGLSPRVIERRLETGRLHLLHRGVYAFGHTRINLRGLWLAAVLACGDDALLSHRSAAALWGLVRPRNPVEVSSASGRGRQGIVIRRGRLDTADRAVVARIPVTSVARTLFDLAEVVDEKRLGRAFEEADRLRLLEMPALEEVCARGRGRRALRPVRRLIDEAREPAPGRSPLENRFAEFCHEHELPPAVPNVEVLGREVDAFWPRERLMVEVDSYAYHSHRAAFERDRARDAAMQAQGYRVIRVTHRRLEREPAVIAEEIRSLLDSPRKDGRDGT